MVVCKSGLPLLSLCIQNRQSVGGCLAKLFFSRLPECLRVIDRIPQALRRFNGSGFLSCNTKVKRKFFFQLLHSFCIAALCKAHSLQRVAIQSLIITKKSGNSSVSEVHPPQIFQPFHTRCKAGQIGTIYFPSANFIVPGNIIEIRKILIQKIQRLLICRRWQGAHLCFHKFSDFFDTEFTHRAEIKIHPTFQIAIDHQGTIQYLQPPIG